MRLSVFEKVRGEGKIRQLKDAVQNLGRLVL